MPTHDFIHYKEIDKARHEQNMPENIATPAPKGWVLNDDGTKPGYDIRPQENDGLLTGNPGQNIGYAYKLLNEVFEDVVLVDGEHKHDVYPLLAEIAMRRASVFARSPIPSDIGFAIRILSYGGTPTNGEEKWRPQLIRDTGHDEHRRRTIVNSIPQEIIVGNQESLEQTVNGWWEKLEGLF